MNLGYLQMISCLLLATAAPAAKVSDAPKLVGILEELNIPEESNATITCSLGSGKLEGLTYQWYKEKERLFASPNKVRIEAPVDNYQSVLRIVDLEPSDSALYTCSASNRYGQDKITTKLNVRVQLKWTVEPGSELRFPVGKQVHVPCLAEGNPQPQIQWIRLNSDSSNNNNNNDGGESNAIGTELRFSSIGQRDAGYYECRASNGVEEDLVARVKLEVQVSQVPKIVDLVDKLNHPEGTNASFTCSIGSGDLTGLIYEWRKDDTLLGANQQRIRIITAPDNFQSVLRVMDLRPLDAGVYSCQARNKFGQDKIYTRLNVKVQLKWTAQPKDVEVSAGKSLHVPCRADGVPKPTIEWRKLDDSSEPLGLELRFSSARPEDGGQYECKASNGLEKDLVARMTLKVLGK